MPLPVLANHFPEQLISKEAWVCPSELTARRLRLDRRGPVAELPSEPDLELAPLIESGSSYWGQHERYREPFRRSAPRALLRDRPAESLGVAPGADAVEDGLNGPGGLPVFGPLRCV